MKKRKITYGVDGMMEYQAIMTVGKAKMKVHFSDGFITARGITPATFTTDNLVVQRAIEQSTDFKRGRIKIIRVITLDEEVTIGRNPIKPTEDIPDTKAIVASNGADNDDANQEIHGDSSVDNHNEPEEKNCVQIEVNCNDDAKDYLEEHFGVIRSKLRVRADIQSVAATHGIEFIFK